MDLVTETDKPAGWVHNPKNLVGIGNSLYSMSTKLIFLFIEPEWISCGEPN